MSAFERFTRRKVETPASQISIQPLPRNQIHEIISENIALIDYDFARLHFIAASAHQYLQPSLHASAHQYLQPSPLLENNLHGLRYAPCNPLHLDDQIIHHKRCSDQESMPRKSSMTNYFPGHVRDISSDTPNGDYFDCLRQTKEPNLINANPRFDANPQFRRPHSDQPSIPEQRDSIETLGGFQPAKWSVPMTELAPTAPASAPSATLPSAKHHTFPPPFTSPQFAATTAGPPESQPGRRRNANRIVHRWGLAQWPADAGALMRRQQQNREAQRRFREKNRRLRCALADSAMAGVSADSGE
jgi:hypothetical protein